MLKVDRLPIRQSVLARPIGEFVQQARVSFLGMLRLSAFVSEILQKIFNQRLHLRLILPV
jgi:hypothetical protein